MAIALPATHSGNKIQKKIRFPNIPRTQQTGLSHLIHEQQQLIPAYKPKIRIAR